MTTINIRTTVNEPTGGTSISTPPPPPPPPPPPAQNLSVQVSGPPGAEFSIQTGDGNIANNFTGHIPNQGSLYESIQEVAGSENVTINLQVSANSSGTGGTGSVSSGAGSTVSSGTGSVSSGTGATVSSGTGSVGNSTGSAVTTVTQPGGGNVQMPGGSVSTGAVSNATVTGGNSATSSQAFATSSAAANILAQSSPARQLEAGAAGFAQYQAAGGSENSQAWLNNDLKNASPQAASAVQSAAASAISSTDLVTKSELGTLGFSSGNVTQSTGVTNSSGTGGAGSATSSQTLATSTAAVNILAQSSSAGWLEAGAAGFAQYQAAGGSENSQTWLNNDLKNASPSAASAVQSAAASAISSSDLVTKSELGTLGFSSGNVSVSNATVSTSNGTGATSSQTLATSTAAANILAASTPYLQVNNAILGWQAYQAAGGSENTQTWLNNDLKNISPAAASAVSAAAISESGSGDPVVKNSLRDLGFSSTAGSVSSTTVGSVSSQTVATSTTVQSVFGDLEAGNTNQAILDAAAGFKAYQAAGGKDDAQTWIRNDIGGGASFGSAADNVSYYLESSAPITLANNLVSPSIAAVLQSLGISSGTTA